MNRKQKTAVVGTGVVVGGTFSLFHSHIDQIVERFLVSRKVARKAFAIMLMRTLAGQYVNFDLYDETVNNRIFIGILNEIDP